LASKIGLVLQIRASKCGARSTECDGKRTKGPYRIAPLIQIFSLFNLHPNRGSMSAMIKEPFTEAAALALPRLPRYVDSQARSSPDPFLDVGDLFSIKSVRSRAAVPALILVASRVLWLARTSSNSNFTGQSSSHFANVILRRLIAIFKAVYKYARERMSNKPEPCTPAGFAACLRAFGATKNLSCKKPSVIVAKNKKNDNALRSPCAIMVTYTKESLP
jgi:hypothetical protein